MHKRRHAQKRELGPEQEPARPIPVIHCELRLQKTGAVGTKATQSTVLSAQIG